MLSLINNPIRCWVSQEHVLHLNPSIALVSNPNKRFLFPRKAAVLGYSLFIGKKREDIFGFLEVTGGREKSWLNNSWRCGCKDGSETEGDFELEAQILEFMDKSSNPGLFPSKNQLVEAGRLDLVEAIKKRGGWFSLGWESDEEHDGVKAVEDESLRVNFDVADFQRRVDSCKESGSLGENEVDSSSPSFSARSNSPSGESSNSSSQPASSSVRSLETGAQLNSGIEGILNRLEKERSTAFGFNLGNAGYGSDAASNDPQDWGRFQTSMNEDRAEPDSTNVGKLSDSGAQDSHYTKPDMWKTWSLERAGFRETEFEAAEISYDAYKMENGVPSKEADAAKILDGWKVKNHNHIRVHLQYLETELASALHSLRSRVEESNSKKVSRNSSDELETLSDALEFKENEFMNAQERLRSIRASLAVLEGRMALTIMDAQKILEQKQKLIDNASISLQLLRTTCIVWPNPGSEVLLTGSFDGWTTQTKMEKSATGVFSVSLKLYPGKYEIKFIVDGVWKIDPLRPTVHNNGFENNSLIVS